jgi:two-component system sensor histidine kinase PilS (NtrC family)
MDVVHGEISEGERRALERVKVLLFLRLAAVLASLAVILVSQAGRGAFEPGLLPIYTLLVLVSLVNVVYLALVGRVRHGVTKRTSSRLGSPRRFAALQIYLDVLFASALVYLSGAGDSNITFLYFACILAASIFLGVGPGVMVASLVTAIQGGMKTLSFLSGHYEWVLPWMHSSGPQLPVMGISSGVAYLMAQAVAYYLVAVLAGRLAHGLSGVRLLNEKILENITDGVLAVDNDRRVRLINREAMRLLGLPDGTRTDGKTLDEVLTGSKNVELLRELFECEQPGISQVTLATADGHTAPVAITSSVLLEERRKRLGLVVMLIDLTERKRLEEALARAQTMETVGQLAASIAHEIRNPLACIRGSAQEIRSELTGDKECTRLLDLVVKESDRINAIVTSFLHFSKMRHTALTLCNVTDVLSDVVTMLENPQGTSNAGSPNATNGVWGPLNCVWGPRDGRVKIVFDAARPVFCLGDVEQLRQVFLNLGLNALEAMPGGGRLDVRVRREETDFRTGSLHCDVPRVVVEFSDQGEGMTEGVKAQLFKPFFTTKPRGTGLGLSIVWRIIEAHKGRIEVESAPGRGSTFRVILDGYPAVEGGGEQVSRRAVEQVRTGMH